MPIKKRYIECDCGELFTEAKGGLEGKIKYSSWKHEGSRVRSGKTIDGADIVLTEFVRYAKCEKCDGSLMIEKKNYELSPAPTKDEKDHAHISLNREFVMTSSKESSSSGSGVNLKNE